MAEDIGPESGKIRVKIVCPQKQVAEMDVDSVQIPAQQGIRLIRANQAPLFCLLKKGELVLNRAGQGAIVYMISAGVCEIRRDICSVLAWAQSLSEVDPEKIKEDIKEAETVMKNIHLPEARLALQNRIDFYREIISRISG